MCPMLLYIAVKCKLCRLVERITDTDHSPYTPTGLSETHNSSMVKLLHSLLLYIIIIPADINNIVILL